MSRYSKEYIKKKKTLNTYVKSRPTSSKDALLKSAPLSRSMLERRREEISSSIQSTVDHTQGQLMSLHGNYRLQQIKSSLGERSNSINSVAESQGEIKSILSSVDSAHAIHHESSTANMAVVISASSLKPGNSEQELIQKYLKAEAELNNDIEEVEQNEKKLQQDDVISEIKMPMECLSSQIISVNNAGDRFQKYIKTKMVDTEATEISPLISPRLNNY